MSTHSATISSSSGPSRLVVPVPGVAGVHGTPEATGELVGTIVFDPSAYTPTTPPDVERTIKLVAVLWRSAVGQTCTLRMLDPLGNEVASLTSTSALPEEKVSAALSAGAELADARTLYELWLERSGGTTNDYVYCSLAQLEVSYS